MHILISLVVGALTGTVTRTLAPADIPGASFGDVALGMMGAVAGGLTFNAADGLLNAGWPGGVLASLFGAAALILISHTVVRRHNG